MCRGAVEHAGGGFGLRLLESLPHAARHGVCLPVRVAVAMRVPTIFVVVAAAARPAYVAVLSLPVIVAAARTMLVAVPSVRVLVAVLVLGLNHVRRRGRRRREGAAAVPAVTGVNRGHGGHRT